MKYIFVDFEMNPIESKFKKEKQVCPREIIEIGAVMLDEQYNEIASFRKYVKPQYNSSIYKRYEELTGIESRMVLSAETFDESMHAFMEWCGHDEYSIYAWSENDKLQIEKEMELKCITLDESYEYMLSHWKDFQKDFEKLINVSHRMSLENALSTCGILFQGKKHDALFDARNTSLLFIEANVNDINECIFEMKEHLSDESDVLTLGELFDFSKLNIQYT